MLFPNWTGWHWIKTALIVLTMAAPTWLPQPWQVPVMQILAGIAGVVVLLSGSALGPAMLKKGMKAVPIALVLLFVGSASAPALLTSCTPAQQAEVTQIQQWVEADLVAGMGFPQIFQDVSQRIGGPFAGDLATVILDCIQLALDGGKLPPSAQAHAVMVRAEARAQIRARSTDAGVGE